MGITVRETCGVISNPKMTEKRVADHVNQTEPDALYFAVSCDDKSSAYCSIALDQAGGK